MYAFRIWGLAFFLGGGGGEQYFFGGGKIKGKYPLCWENTVLDLLSRVQEVAVLSAAVGPPVAGLDLVLRLGGLELLH